MSLQRIGQRPVTSICLRIKLSSYEFLESVVENPRLEDLRREFHFSKKCDCGRSAHFLLGRSYRFHCNEGNENQVPYHFR